MTRGKKLKTWLNLPCRKKTLKINAPKKCVQEGSLGASVFPYGLLDVSSSLWGMFIHKELWGLAIPIIRSRFWVFVPLSFTCASHSGISIFSPVFKYRLVLGHVMWSWCRFNSNGPWREHFVPTVGLYKHPSKSDFPQSMNYNGFRFRSQYFNSGFVVGKWIVKPNEGPQVQNCQNISLIKM